MDPHLRLNQDLREAISRGDVGEVELLGSGGDWNVKAPCGSTPLGMACSKGHYKLVQFLLQQPGIHINVPNGCGKSPFHEACAHGHVEIAQLLLDYAGSTMCATKDDGPVIDLMDTCDNVGETPLMAACNREHLETVMFLVQRGQLALAQKALVAACATLNAGGRRIVEWIVETYPDWRDELLNKGRTPLREALRAWKYGHKLSDSVHQSKIGLIEYLLEMGTKIDADSFSYAVTSQNETAVYLMVRFHPELWGPLQDFLENSPNSDENDNTPQAQKQQRIFDASGTKARRHQRRSSTWGCNRATDEEVDDSSFVRVRDTSSVLVASICDSYLAGSVGLRWVDEIDLASLAAEAPRPNNMNDSSHRIPAEVILNFDNDDNNNDGIEDESFDDNDDSANTQDAVRWTPARNLSGETFAPFEMDVHSVSSSAASAVSVLAESIVRRKQSGLLPRDSLEDLRMPSRVRHHPRRKMRRDRRS